MRLRPAQLWSALRRGLASSTRGRWQGASVRDPRISWTLIGWKKIEQSRSLTATWARRKGDGLGSEKVQPEKDWHPARLIPTAGIRGQEEQERRATSALLAVLPVVPAFGHALLAAMKAPKGRISTFTEVRLKDPSGKTHIPDGAIVVERGKKRWSCLVEVKTSRVPLDGDQVSRYLEMAREHGFDGVLTISNQIRTSPEVVPYPVDKRKVGRLMVRHYSWWRILTEAIVQHRFRGVDDPEQAFILNELIRYLDDEKSGASGFEGMGEEWTQVRDAARHDTLRPSDPQAGIIATRWEQFLEYLALQLSQDLGVAVQQQRPRAKGPAERIGAATDALASEGRLSGTLRIPDAIGPLGIEANLRTGRVITTVEVDAPKEGRPGTRINWMLRQLRDAPDDLRVETRFVQSRSTRTELLRDCRENPNALLLEDDPKREPRAFLLALSRQMGRKRGRTEGSFVSETRRQTVDFYRDLVQNLTPPRPKAPQLPKVTEEQQPERQDADLGTSEAAARREQEAGLKQIAEIAQFDTPD